jgi:hypothetical protein
LQGGGAKNSVRDLFCYDAVHAKEKNFAALQRGERILGL